MAEAVGDVAGAVVGHDCLYGNASLGVPGNCSAEEGDRTARREVVEDLGVGEPGVVVDHHVHVLMTGGTRSAIDPGRVLARSVSEHAMACATCRDAAEALDVDVHELAGMAALVAVGWLGWLQTRALAQTQALEPQRDAGERQREDLRDLRSRHAQTAKCLDHTHALGGQSHRAAPWPRGAVVQRVITVAIAAQPLGCRALAAAGRLGGTRDRPALLEHAPTDEPAATRTGPMVSVESHPVTSLVWWLRHPQPPRRPG